MQAKGCRDNPLFLGTSPVARSINSSINLEVSKLWDFKRIGSKSFERSFGQSSFSAECQKKSHPEGEAHMAVRDFGQATDWQEKPVENSMRAMQQNIWKGSEREGAPRSIGRGERRQSKKPREGAVREKEKTEKERRERRRKG
jgi:hypothetical protein